MPSVRKSSSKKITIHYSEKGSGFIFDHEDGSVYLLNTSVTYIYGLLNQGMTLMEVIDKVSTEFCVDRGAIAEEITEFAAELSQLDLVRQ